jgi:hypothetical protein
MILEPYLTVSLISISSPLVSIPVMRTLVKLLRFRCAPV